MRLIYCKNNINKHVGQVKELWHKNNEIYYKIVYPRTGDIYYVKAKDCKLENGILYHEII